MNDGYEKFFRQIKKVRREQNENPPPKSRAVKRPRVKRAFPIRSLLFLGMICTGLGWWSVDPQLPDRVLHLVEVRMIGAAEAADTSNPAKSAPAKPPGQANAAASLAPEKSTEGGATHDAVGEDNSHLEKLRERKNALDLREKELNELEEELHRQKEEIEARIKRLEELRVQISSVLKDRVDIDQEKVTKLVETYSNMKPKQAADILSGIDEDLAVEILAKMKKKNAAEIMNLLESGKARALSEKYAGYKRR